MPTAPLTAFAPYLSHADAGIRGRAWVWQSAIGLQSVEGNPPSAYLIETACQHIAGAIPMELAGKLIDIYHLSAPAAAAADARILEFARMLNDKLGQPPTTAPASAAAPVPAAPPAAPAAAPESADALHIRQKRLLRTLGSQTLSVPELLHALRLSSRQSFTRVWLAPVMEMGLVKALHPDSPRHPQQQYLLTRKGQRLLKQLNRK